MTKRLSPERIARWRERLTNGYQGSEEWEILGHIDAIEAELLRVTNAFLDTAGRLGKDKDDLLKELAEAKAEIARLKGVIDRMLTEHDELEELARRANDE